MRTIAKLFNNKDKDYSNRLLEEADSLLKDVMKLYVDEKGFWNTRFPNNKLVEVRHCYDLLMILNTIPQDLSSKQKEEITNFFVEELQTERWLRALSPKDRNTMFSVRPDHQWNGAYTAWPAYTVSGLYKIGKSDLAFKWLKGLAKSANQGPFAQGHFVENAFSPDSDGALKCYPEWPYATDWACSSNGSWIVPIIESIFGVKATLRNGITAKPEFNDFDKSAELLNLDYQGKLYNVNKNGLTSLS